MGLVLLSLPARAIAGIPALSVAAVSTSVTPQAPEAPGAKPEPEPKDEEQPEAEAKDEKPTTPETSHPRRFRVLIGYGGYAMEDFNEKLKREGNKEIDGGLNMALEFVGDFEIKPPGGVVPALFLPAIGIEYLTASSTTTHVDDAGSTTVDWELPVLGLYVAPELALLRHQRLYLRPVAVGYYTLGEVTPARLTISDRPGELEISGSTVGGFIEAGLQWSIGRLQTSLVLGYRYLKFTDVTRTPRGGFTAVPGGPSISPSALAEDLDYSGPFLRLGVSVEMGSGKGPAPSGTKLAEVRALAAPYR